MERKKQSKVYNIFCNSTHEKTKSLISRHERDRKKEIPPLVFEPRKRKILKKINE